METLNEHKNRHNGIKPFVCPICDKGINYWQSLINILTNTYFGLYVYQLTIAPAFSESSGYGKHMKKHNAKTSEPEALEVNDN